MSKRKQTDYIVIHSTCTPPDMEVSFRTVDEWHRKRGWLKIGYHFFIASNGTIEVGRNIHEVGAHTKGYNGTSIGIVLVGGTDKSGNPDPYFSAPQWEALFSLVNSLTFMYRSAKVVGHGELVGQSCPCFSVKKWWANNSELIYGKTGYNNDQI
jgi:N-acetylmuramoyl-L-alanine amidase